MEARPAIAKPAPMQLTEDYDIGGSYSDAKSKERMITRIARRGN